MREEMDGLKKGDRVIVHPPSRRSFRGVIVGEGRTKQWWHVRKDGTKRPQAYSKAICWPEHTRSGPPASERGRPPVR